MMVMESAASQVDRLRCGDCEGHSARNIIFILIKAFSKSLYPEWKHLQLCLKVFLHSFSHFFHELVTHLYINKKKENNHASNVG